MNKFESWLEDKFISNGVIGETPITKDNCETLFDSYLQRLDVQELLDLGEEYGKEMFELGKQDWLTEPH